MAGGVLPGTPQKEGRHSLLTELSIYHAPVLPKLRRPSEVSLAFLKCRKEGSGVSEHLSEPRVVRGCVRTVQKSHD